MMPATPLSSHQLIKLLELRDFKTLRKSFKEAELADIGELLSDAPLEASIAMLRLVPRNRRSDLFSYMEAERQAELIEELPDEIVTSFVNEMEPDNRTKLLEAVTEEIRDQILRRLDPEEESIARQLLSYPEDSVGRLMTPDFLALAPDMTVAEALDSIRWKTSIPPEFLHYLFVTDATGVLLGEVSLASLILSDPTNLPIQLVMKQTHVTLTPEQENGEAVELFRKYDRNYMPVVSDVGILVGIVTADDVFDVAEEEATEDIQQFGGQAVLEYSYFQTPVLTMVRKRVGWLAVLFISGFLSGHAIRNYEDTFSKWSFLMFFLPMIIAAGGNSGTQSASLVIRGMALNEITAQDMWRVFCRELSVGLVLGLCLASIGYFLPGIWGLDPRIGVVIAMSLVCVVIFGVLSGSMLPFVFRSLKLDPAVVSSPFISTLVDLSGILILFNIFLLMMKFIPFG